MADLRVVVVEDEPAARRLLVQLLSLQPEVQLVGESGHGREAVRIIRATAPDLVFLDVEMPDLDGFGVIEAIGADRMPAVVFVTAFDGYAVKAFDVHALDYLVKPFSDARFAATLRRARLRLAERVAAPVARFAVRRGSRTLLVGADEIDWIEAQDYCALLHAGAAAYLVRHSIRALEGQLDPRRFARVSRSAIVNLDRVRRLDRPTDGAWTVTLTSGAVLPVARRRRERMVRLLAEPGFAAG